MKSKLLFALVSINFAFLAFSTISSNMHTSVQELGPMPKEIAQDYGETFLKTYIQQVEDNFRSQYRQYFDFYANLPYKINATISSTHGAAMEFVPENEQMFDFRMVEQRIELVVFPEIDLNMTSLDVNATVLIWTGEPSQGMFAISGKRNVISGGIFITNTGHLMDLEIGGSVLLLNVNVDGRYYYAMMVKGSNTADAWTKHDAEAEAIDLFEEDLFHAFNQSEEIRKYMAYPLLEELISQIVWKHQHAEEIGYDLLQYYEDLAKVRELAVSKYHLNSTFVDEILNWLENIYPQQPWWEVAPNSWVIGAVIGVPVTMVFERLILRAYKSLKRRRIKRRLKLPKSPFKYTLAIFIKKGAFCPMEGKPYKMTITIKNISKKAFPGSVLESVFVRPTPFSMKYSWEKLDIPQLDEEGEIDEEIYYYPRSSGQRELRIRTTDKNIGLLTIKGKMPMIGSELREPFRVYSWTDILQLGGALSAIIGAIVGIIILLLRVLGQS